MTPSRALHCHLRRCGSVRRWDIATPVAVPRTASRQRHPRISMRVVTKRAPPTPPPSKPLLDGYRARHDVPPEARFARTAVYSTALYAMPPHIDKTVRHACKLPLPWPIKEGQSPGRRGATDSTHSHAFCLHRDIGTRLNQRTSGTWRPGLLSHLACAPPPLQALRCNAIQCLEHTTARRTTTAGTRINQCHLVA
jgi:hypothetical protein